MTSYIFLSFKKFFFYKYFTEKKKHISSFNKQPAPFFYNQEFMGSIKCTKENWKDKLNFFFNTTREIYSRHFNQPVTLEGFPSSYRELHQDYEIEYADKEVCRFTACLPSRQNCRKSSRVECIFVYTALHFECRFKKNTLLQCYFFGVFTGYPAVCMTKSVWILRLASSCFQA